MWLFQKVLEYKNAKWVSHEICIYIAQDFDTTILLSKDFCHEPFGNFKERNSKYIHCYRTHIVGILMGSHVGLTLVIQQMLHLISSENTIYIYPNQSKYLFYYGFGDFSCILHFNHTLGKVPLGYNFFYILSQSLLHL